jgi:hypothetical protein
MRQLRIGVVVVTGDTGPARATARWTEIRNLALHAEALGFDTVWTIDELLWRPADKAPSGFWEGVAMAGAVAAATSRIEVGTRLMSALHRNPGITESGRDARRDQRRPVHPGARGWSRVARPGAGVRAARGPRL